MPSEEIEETNTSGLPLYVRINEKYGMMWYDDISGLQLSCIRNATDKYGNAVKNFGRIPNGVDTTRIKLALDNKILIPCDPTGKVSGYEPPPLFKEDSIAKLMGNSSKILIVYINNIFDRELLTKMREFELSKESRKQRRSVINTINERLRSRDIAGVTEVKEKANMVYDPSSGRLVKDVVKVGAK